MNAQLTQKTTDVELAKYKAAGELFGRIHKMLGFGELSMFTGPESLQMFTYRWTFKANGELHCSQEVVNVLQLVVNDQSIESRSGGIVNKWKHYHRTIGESDGLQTIQGSERRDRAEHEAAPTVS